MEHGLSRAWCSDAEIAWHLMVVLIGLEIRYGSLDSFLVTAEASEDKARQSEETINTLRQLVPKIETTVGNVDRLLPRLLVVIGREPAGGNCAAFSRFRGELIRLWRQPSVVLSEWQQLARSVPLGVKLNIAMTADRVAQRFPFLLQEYLLHRQPVRTA